MNETKQAILTIVAEVLGVEPADIAEDADFILDLNATPDDLSKIKTNLEQTMDIILPDLNQQIDFTVANLMDLVEDSLLWSTCL